MPGFLCGCWRSVLSSSCLHGESTLLTELSVQYPSNSCMSSVLPATGDNIKKHDFWVPGAPRLVTLVTNGFPREFPPPTTLLISTFPSSFLPGLSRFLCAVSGCPACPAGGFMPAWSATALSDNTRARWWRRLFPTLCTVPRTMTMMWLYCSSGRQSTSQVRLWPWNEQAGCSGV